MAILSAIYKKLEELYGGDVAVKAICISGAVGLFVLSMMLKPQQPIVIINEIKNNEEV